MSYSQSDDGSTGNPEKRYKVKDENDMSQLEGSEKDLEYMPMAPPEEAQQFDPKLVQTIGNTEAVGAGAGPGPGHDDSSVSGASTNSTFSETSHDSTFSETSQRSIQSIAESVQSIASGLSVASGLPQPDADRMLIEFVNGVYKLTVNGMELFNRVAQTAGGYGPVASIAFISLLSANPDLLPTINFTTISLPTIDLTSIASQIGLAANVAQAAATQAAPAGFVNSFTSAAASIGNGIMAGVTAIVTVIGTNQVVANPLTIDNIAGLVESVGNNAIDAVITVADFQSRMWTVVEKLKAKWLVSRLQVKGISTLDRAAVNQLVSDAVTIATNLRPDDTHTDDIRPVNSEQLVLAYSNIVNRIDKIAPPKRVVKGDIGRVIPQVADEMIAAAAGGASRGKPGDDVSRGKRGGGGDYGGKKNRKSQKKSRKKVTRSKRGKKAARETKKQSRRKSRGKKHGKKH